MTTPQVNNTTGNFIPLNLGTHGDQAEEVDLNEILHLVLNKYTIDQQLNFILRLDPLPVVVGNKEHFDCLFDSLISMIVDHPPVNSKLFLYIKCETLPTDNEIIDLQLAPGKQFNKIDFYTNINTNDQWKTAFNTKLTECAELATNNNGSFSFFPISNTGCLFSIVLPGKFN
ncbi:MAG TPA: hypothetical protein VMY77_18635 [Chitinophagaceae bacterium]|nr:hypothetical protein [Chitinophagaceae bacterium]